MFTKCSICGSRVKNAIRFRVAPGDAIGFVCLVLVSSAPVLFVSFLAGLTMGAAKGRYMAVCSSM